MEFFLRGLIYSEREKENVRVWSVIRGKGRNDCIWDLGRMKKGERKCYFFLDLKSDNGFL